MISRKHEVVNLITESDGRQDFCTVITFCEKALGGKHSLFVKTSGQMCLTKQMWRNVTNREGFNLILVLGAMLLSDVLVTREPSVKRSYNISEFTGRLASCRSMSIK